MTPTDPNERAREFRSPGPWTAELVLAGYQSNGYRIKDAEGNVIARTCAVDEATDEANAEAICALSHVAAAQRPGAVAGWALTKLRDHEMACKSCGRAVWDRKGNALGFLAPCGNRIARLEDCGTVDCIDALSQPASGEAS